MKIIQKPNEGRNALLDGLVLANVMVAKTDALGRECGNYVHYSINGVGFDPAAS